jgi:serine/threonine protein kinase/WD40 repeat protein
MIITCPACGKPNRSGANFCAVCGAALTIGTQRLQPGQILRNGDYRVVRPLSKGGMGAIYLAENLQAFGRPCVIKEMLDYFDPTNPTQAANARKRFEDEARTLAQLHHPGIPDIQAYFSEGGRNYIVMEYVEGVSLDQAVTRVNASGQTLVGQRQPPEQIVRYGIQLCEILEYLSRLSPPVIHHDIKPANIIVDKNTGSARLVDFGTARARLTAQPGGKVGLQRSSIYGTEGYAPPEQYSGQSEPRSDVYALAATLYHLLTDDDPGAHPFKFPRLTGLPLDLGPVLEKALEPSVGRRITAAELRQVLAAVLQQVLRPPAPTRTTLRKSARAAPVLDAHESFAIIAPQGIPDTVRLSVIQYLSTRLGLTPESSEILTWQVPASIAKGLDANHAMSLENALRGLGAPIQRLLTSQVLGWRTGMPNLDKRLTTEGEIVLSPVRIPADRVCHCYTCGHEWKTRARALPPKCPRCKSTSWSRHRLFQCAICGHQFADGNIWSPPEKLFSECPACHVQAWHPRQQPQLRDTLFRVDAGKVLVGQTAAVKVILSEGGRADLRGRVTPEAPWIKVRQPAFSGDQMQVLVDTSGLPTKQTHTGSLDIVSNAGQARIEVTVYVDEPPRLMVSTPALDFGILNAREERTLVLTISNVGGHILQGGASDAPVWLRLNATDFRGDRTDLRLTVHGRDLPIAGRNTANLTIDSNGGKISVDVVATALPTTLAVEPTSLNFGYQPRGKHVRCRLNLSNLGVGMLEGRIVTGQPWLTVDPPEFHGNRVSVSVIADTEALIPSGVFDAQLAIASNGGDAVVPVRIEVSPYRWLEHTLRLNRRLQAALSGLTLVLVLIAWFALSRPTPVSQIAWGPAGGGLLMSNNSIYHLEASSDKISMRLVRSGLEPTAVTVSADGNWAAWADAHGGIEIWETSQPSSRLLVFPLPIAGIHFDAADTRLVWVMTNGVFGWVDPARDQPERTGTHHGKVEHLTFSPDGGWLAIAGEGQIFVYSIDASRQFQVSAPDSVTAVALAPGGDELAWAAPAGLVHRWSPELQEVGKLQTDSTSAIVILTYDPSGQLLAWAHADGQVGVWDLSKHRVLARTNRAKGRVLSLAYGLDGEYLAIGTSNRLEMWQLP